jgi:hypothetical protein
MHRITKVVGVPLRARGPAVEYPPDELEPRPVLAGRLDATAPERLAGNQRPVRLGVARPCAGEPRRLQGRRSCQVGIHRIGAVEVDPAIVIKPA